MNKEELKQSIEEIKDDFIDMLFEEEVKLELNNIFGKVGDLNVIDSTIIIDNISKSCEDKIDISKDNNDCIKYELEKEIEYMIIQSIEDLRTSTTRETAIETLEDCIKILKVINDGE